MNSGSASAGSDGLYLTTSKRFEFSASHRLFVPGWSEEENLRVYGRESRGTKGHGHNFVVFLVVHGPVDARTGMLMNVTTIKERGLDLLAGRFDHKFLNHDTPPFDAIVPTAENIAERILAESVPRFDDQPARPVVCHLLEPPLWEGTAYEDGRVERSASLRFSAARRTFSPHLSDEENRSLFGICSAPAGHGHNYELRVTLAGDVDHTSGVIFPPSEAEKIFSELRGRFDHRNLNVDLADYGSRPMTTECLSRYIWTKLAPRLPLARLRLSENEDFFVEYHAGDRFFMGLRLGFLAAHRLHSPRFSEEENRRVYGKCTNPEGHGHDYRVEATFRGTLDERRGILFPLDSLLAGLRKVLDAWDYTHLEEETGEFDENPSTGENIVQILWSKLDGIAGATLARLRLWETANNRFTLRGNK
jgi:6-pyruvoyltetrahydropterin/6-carboxytetrahydropterin synthase